MTTWQITFRTCLLAFSILAFRPGAPCADAADIVPFLAKNCIACHGDGHAEAGLNLSDLNSDLSDLQTAERWIRIHDRVQSGEMPPAEADQPTTSERDSFVAAAAERIRQAESSRRDVVFRRLNRIEYQNTVNDLFGIDVLVKDVLPEDGSLSGFDNVGEGLSVSAEAIKAYLKAADVVLDATFGPATEPKRVYHETNLLDQLTWDGKPQLESQIGKMFRRTNDGLVIFQSGYCPTNLVNFGRLRVPAGTYRGQFRVRAIQSDKPVTLRIYGGDTVVGRRENHLVGYYDVPPNEWTTIEFVDRLVEPSGTYLPKCYNTRDTRKNADSYPEPGIEIGDIVIEGPLEQWPPPSRKQLLGNADPATATIDDARAILSRVATGAFRRPAKPDEIEPFVTLVAASLSNGETFENALRVGLKAILCSPHFLFLDESPATTKDPINTYALASRLSYFLWSSQPDDRLLELAANGQLRQPEVLHEQVERMLADDRSAAFRTHFPGQWLDLREIEFTEPDANLFPEFDELLRLSMVEETERFFSHVLDENLDIMTFVDADFSFLNERLAAHYGIDGVIGQQFRKVDLHDAHVRGGVLTHGSVLKVTANGTNTSPVIRGAWVLDKILGQPAPPPPDNVPAVEPDIRGTTTLREQLAAHRNVESCSSCHNIIDPPGFALENFDPIGGWRVTYRTLGDGDRPNLKQAPFTYEWVRYRLGSPVDASGTTPDGTAFTDIRDFRAWLTNHRPAITRSLTTKLLTYATGRTMGFSDREEIDQIASNTKGFRNLVHSVVQSQSFQAP